MPAAWCAYLTYCHGQSEYEKKNYVEVRFQILEAALDTLVLMVLEVEWELMAMVLWVLNVLQVV